MIPKAFITEWRMHAPWSQGAWVEQDLIISRALVEMFQVDSLRARLAFRGGTALYKLHLDPPARYSEDIDLVQVNAEPIGDTLNEIRRVLDPWLGLPRWERKEGSVKLVYRFESEDSPPIPLRLKIEINSREHFSHLGLIAIPFHVESRWFRGVAQVRTFRIEELLGTKLRALYQRKKGRDLFDLWFALKKGEVDRDETLACFRRYMEEDGHRVSRAQFEENLWKKGEELEFRGDISPLLRPEVEWSFETGMKTVWEELVGRLPGDPWKGRLNRP